MSFKYLFKFIVIGDASCGKTSYCLRLTDNQFSCEKNNTVGVEFSAKILKPNGVLVSKLFMGEDFLEVKELAKSRFKKVDFFKPEASRNESKETYLHCSILKTL